MWSVKSAMPQQQCQEHSIAGHTCRGRATLWLPDTPAHEHVHHPESSPEGEGLQDRNRWTLQRTKGMKLLLVFQPATVH